jgi:5'-deoxynucleotidase YfbR-like HD superfamily hydrolase
MPPGSNWIQTFTGQKFDPLKPRASDVRLEDVAHALALVCRFTGHVRHFYSVAEHSVRVSLLAERYAIEGKRRPEDVRMIARWGLMHDGSEAYLADVASPVKRSAIFAGYRTAEKRLLRVITDACHLPPDMPAEVSRADLVLLATEARELLQGGPIDNWTDRIETLEGAQGFGWDPVSAEGRFLERFRALGEEAAP